MAQLRMIEDDKVFFSVNPWEEELRKRDESKEESDNDDGAEEEVEREQEQQFQASQQNFLPTRSIPEASNQKGLAVIFGKVDRQIELLDEQVNAIQAELLQARNLVTAVRSTVANLNKPDASELLERDAFTNYLRITDRLKAISNNICMIIPDHGRQVVRADNAYTYYNGYAYSDSEFDYPYSLPTNYFPEFITDESVYDGASSQEPSVSESSLYAYASHNILSPPSSRQQWTRKRLFSTGPTSMRRGNNRQPELTSPYCHTVRSAAKVRRSSNSAASRLAVDSPPDTSSRKEARKRFRTPSQNYPYHASKRRVATAARRSRPPPLHRPEGNEIESGERWVEEEIRIPSEESQLVFVEPKGMQHAISLEAILHEERTFLLEKLYKVQEQLEAAQTRPVVMSPLKGGGEVKESISKEKIWTRLMSKFVDHSKKQRGHDIGE